MNKLFGYLLRFRLAVVLVCAALLVLAVAGLPGLSFNTDYHAFFDKDNPELNDFDEIQRTFVKNDNVMIMVSSVQGEIFQPRVIEALWQLTEQSWKIPYSSRVDSLTNYQYSEADGDDLLVRDLVPREFALTSGNLQHTKKLALAEPELVRRLLSDDGRYTAIYITLTLPKQGDQQQATQVMKEVRQMLKEAGRQYPALVFNVSGVVPMDYAFAEVSMQDGQTLIPLAFIIILAILWILMRSIAAVIATLFVILFSILMAMGIAGWLGIELTPPSASAPLLILTLAVADCIHFISCYHQASTRGLQREEALTEAFKLNYAPIILTSVTSMVGFLGMNFSDAPPFRDLGNITAIGILIACVLSLILVPALLSYFRQPKVSRRAMRGVDRLLVMLSQTVSSYPRCILFGGALIIVSVIALIPQNRLDDTFIHYFDHEVQFRADSDTIEDKLTGLYFIDYSLDSQLENGIYEADFINKVDDFADWLRQQPEVRHVTSVLGTLKRLNKNLHGDDPAWYRLPQQTDQTAQYLFLYEMSLPYGLDLKNQVSFDKSALRLSATLATISTQEVLAFENRVKQWWQDSPDIKVSAGSPTLMFAHISMRNIISMLTGTGLALLAISILMLFVLRSFKYGVFSLLPNLAPAAMAFGLWGLLVGEVGLAVSVVAAMSLGIVVDDTIHLLYKCQYLRRRGMSIQVAVDSSLRQVGTAIIATSLMLGAGFGILALSHFQVNAQMGLLTAVCIILALLLDLIVLPALLLVGDRDKQTQGIVVPPQ